VTDPFIAEQILDLARWAPSGDNTQPWRFRIEAADHIVVLGHDTREHCVYDLRGEASRLAHGALLECLVLAASRHGLRADITTRGDHPDSAPIYDVRLVPDPAVTPDPLADCIERRTVQRRPMSRRPLTADQQRALEACLAPGYTLRWLAGAERLRMARLLFDNGRLRLRLPEGFPLHRDIIEWGARYSEDRIPEQAVGFDPLTARVSRWALHSWGRLSFLNRYLGGTLLPALQLDFLPGLACGAHAVLLAPRAPQTADDFVAAGRQLMRLWLTATRQGLLLQPEMTPLIFARYLRQGVPFTREQTLRTRAGRVAQALETRIGARDAERAVFMGRIGAGTTPRARSLRLPLGRLLGSTGLHADLRTK
jgi:hypothetical protein